MEQYKLLRDALNYKDFIIKMWLKDEVIRFSEDVLVSLFSLTCKLSPLFLQPDDEKSHPVVLLVLLQKLDYLCLLLWTDFKTDKQSKKTPTTKLLRNHRVFLHISLEFMTHLSYFNFSSFIQLPSLALYKQSLSSWFLEVVIFSNNWVSFLHITQMIKRW